MFRFTRKLSSGNHSQNLAKITHSIQCEYMEVVQRLSVLWLYSTHRTHASQVILCSHNTDNLCTTSMYSH